jgi:hypothetical protein
MLKHPIVEDQWLLKPALTYLSLAPYRLSTILNNLALQIKMVAIIPL